VGRRREGRRGISRWARGRRRRRRVKIRMGVAIDVYSNIIGYYLEK